MSAGGGAVNAIAAEVKPSMLPDAGQLELLRDGEGKLSRHAINQARGAGRPKGARNKRSKKVADYFVQKYGDPLDVLGNLMTMPTKALVELLLEADGGAENQEKLAEMVEEAIDHIKSLSNKNFSGDVNTSRELAEDLSDAIEKLARAAQAINGKPGKLALDALAMQLSATFKALEYVHGKQPISIDFAGKADMVIFAPELLKQFGIDGDELKRAIQERGLEAFDSDKMRLVGPDIEDAEFSEAPSEDEA